jgi:tRNA(fMet)-specific endonuclease VapC
MKVALDANAYSGWKRHGLWNVKISCASEVHVSAAVFGELGFGFACGNLEGRNLAELRGFLAASVVIVDFVTEDTAGHYAALKRFLREQGTTIPENDIWIAAAASEHGVTLLTSDKHFENLPQVRGVSPER